MQKSQYDRAAQRPLTNSTARQQADGVGRASAGHTLTGASGAGRSRATAPEPARRRSNDLALRAPRIAAFRPARSAPWQTPSSAPVVFDRSALALLWRGEPLSRFGDSAVVARAVEALSVRVRSSARAKGALCLLPPYAALDVGTAVGALGGELIVRSAEQTQVVGFGAAALASRLAMVDLEPSLTAAANAMRIDPVAAEPIAFEYCPARGTGNRRGRTRGRAGRRRAGRRRAGRRRAGRRRRRRARWTGGSRRGLCLLRWREVAACPKLRGGGRTVRWFCHRCAGTFATRIGTEATTHQVVDEQLQSPRHDGAEIAAGMRVAQ